MCYNVIKKIYLLKFIYLNDRINLNVFWDEKKIYTIYFTWLVTR